MTRRDQNASDFRESRKLFDAEPFSVNGYRCGTKAPVAKCAAVDFKAWVFVCDGITRIKENLRAQSEALLNTRGNDDLFGVTGNPSSRAQMICEDAAKRPPASRMAVAVVHPGTFREARNNLSPFFARQAVVVWCGNRQRFFGLNMELRSAERQLRAF